MLTTMATTAEAAAETTINNKKSQTINQFYVSFFSLHFFFYLTKESLTIFRAIKCFFSSFFKSKSLCVESRERENKKYLIEKRGKNMRHALTHSEQFSRHTQYSKASQTIKFEFKCACNLTIKNFTSSSPCISTFQTIKIQ